MKRVLTFVVLSLIVNLFSSCDQYTKTNNGLAQVEKIDNVYIFINSKPVTKYTSVGPVENDLIDQYKNATSNKKFGDVLEGIISTTKKNTDFNDLLRYMVEKAKKENDDKVDGLIFQDELSWAEVIRFEDP